MSKDEIMSAQELSEEFRKSKFSGEWVVDEVRYLLGRVLTVIDSSVVDRQQNKAMKDLIKSEFIKTMNKASNALTGGRYVVAPDGSLPLETVSEDEALGLK